jgi:hypothetical protein
MLYRWVRPEIQGESENENTQIREPFGVLKRESILPGTLSGYRVEKAEGTIFK